jgi:uncharacterized Tic20 family protein
MENTTENAVTESPTDLQTIPENEKNLAVFMQVGVIFFFVLSPLVGYLIANEQQGFLKEQSKLALNGCINYLVFSIAGFLLSSTVILGIIGVPILIGVGILTLYAAIKGAMESSNCRLFSYPLTLFRVVS